MSTRKLQVFISSTYLDLKAERQSAVEAVLEAGHIPAGMELFAAGDKSQLEAIRRWIDESDVFVLILGGRYGSIEPVSKKSYIELEYNYAIAKQMPHFAILMTDKTIEDRVKSEGSSVLERAHPAELRELRDRITQKLCSFADDTKDIKLAVFKALQRIGADHPNLGWVPAREATDVSKVATELAALTGENSTLRGELDALRAKLREAQQPTDRTAEFHRIAAHLARRQEMYQSTKINVLETFVVNRNQFVSGVNNAPDSDEAMIFYFFQVAPHLRMLGLLEDNKAAGVKYQRLRTSHLGNDFLVWAVENFPTLRNTYLLRSQAETKTDGSTIAPIAAAMTPAQKEETASGSPAPAAASMPQTKPKAARNHGVRKHSRAKK